ncbi:CHAT domain-containing protein [Anabaena azotica]|uniref:CHAT domain-containing protein n=1 Tax=Anabaena azotica TaxID=197653 RepID=UPI0039A72A54
MQRALSIFFALGITLAPLAVQSANQPGWIQTQNPQIEEVLRLLKQARQQTQQQQPEQAIETFQQLLGIAQQLQDRKLQAIALLGIGFNYSYIGQPQEALKYYNQALPICREISDRSGEAIALNNIGSIYSYIGQPQEALKYYNQALPIRRKISDRYGEATTLNNIGSVYSDIKQPQEALKYYNQALPIRRKISDRSGEATTLNNIGLVYSDIGQPQEALKYYNQALPIRRKISDRYGEAITLNNIGGIHRNTGQPQKALEFFNKALTLHQEIGERFEEATTLSNIGGIYRDLGQIVKATKKFEESVKITLATRGGLTRINRPDFLKAQRGTSIALIDILIRQNQIDSAYEWANLITTADLIDYIRLINAKVKNPDAQKAIDEWNQQNQQLKSLRQQLQEKFSEKLSHQMREQEAKVYQIGEEISHDFPEVAELFENTPTDIAKLRASIPTGTTVIHPVLLANVKNVSNTIALFVLTKDKLTVTTVPIKPAEYDNLLTETLKNLNNRFDDDYLDNLAKLYDLIIRPVEIQIHATNPKQLSFIATDQLRYIPFEALYDSKTDQYLIQKYSVSYLTRISPNSLQVAKKTNPQLPKRVLAVGNPKPKSTLALSGAETEVKSIINIFPESEALIRDKATLESFKTQAPRFSLLHLATHGCFQPRGCPRLGLEKNTLVFADQTLEIKDAALLGLENVDLITLSACQTGFKADSQGQEISGLAYLFERAGAKAVIASLWSVEDKSTQKIMVDFYANIKRGLSKAEALRQAKLSRTKSHPWYWSPFVLIGDPR